MSHSLFGPMRMMTATALLLFAVSGSMAQVKTNGTQDPTKNTVTTQPGATGWSAFTQADQNTLELSDQQMTRLKDMDGGFSDQYKSMGIEPWRNKDFPELNRQRNAAIQDILDEQQYERWARPTTPVPTDPPTIVPDPNTPE